MLYISICYKLHVVRYVLDKIMLIFVESICNLGQQSHKGAPVNYIYLSAGCALS